MQSISGATIGPAEPPLEGHAPSWPKKQPRLALAIRLTALLIRIDITMDEADIACAVYEVLEKESL